MRAVGESTLVLIHVVVLHSWRNCTSCSFSDFTNPLTSFQEHYLYSSTVLKCSTYFITAPQFLFFKTTSDQLIRCRSDVFTFQRLLLQYFELYSNCCTFTFTIQHKQTEHALLHKPYVVFYITIQKGWDVSPSVRKIQYLWDTLSVHLTVGKQGSCEVGHFLSTPKTINLMRW